MSGEPIDIAAHIPHAGSMCLLDEVLAWDETALSALTHRHQDPRNPLLHAGRLGAACGIEIAAQGMALHGALLAKQNESGHHSERPRAGFLASMRDVKLHVTRLDDITTPLQIAVQRLSGDDNTVLYQFSLRSAERLLIEGRAAVMLDAAKARKS